MESLDLISQNSSEDLIASSGSSTASLLSLLLPLERYNSVLIALKLLNLYHFKRRFNLNCTIVIPTVQSVLNFLSTFRPKQIIRNVLYQSRHPQIR